jgi:hypothetical protein
MKFQFKTDKIHLFDVSRLGGIGRSMFHASARFILGFLLDQTGRLAGSGWVDTWADT